MKDRVKVLLNGTSDSQTSEHQLVPPQQQAGQQGQPGQPGAHPNQALQVLTLAQRTAEEHVARAHHQADKIRTDALAAAEQIARDAQVHAHNVRREAEKILTDARAAAEQIADDAQANADHLNLQARQRFDDVVGSLGTRRESLQQQIEALEQFDREYRSRLTQFMQGQLRALWVDQPQVNAELPEQGGPEAPVAGPRHGAADDDSVPAQRQSPEADELAEEEKEAGER
jgi:cell division septum initiation protein DivIVA